MLTPSYFKGVPSFAVPSVVHSSAARSPAAKTLRKVERTSPNVSRYFAPQNSRAPSCPRNFSGETTFPTSASGAKSRTISSNSRPASSLPSASMNLFAICSDMTFKPPSPFSRFAGGQCARELLQLAEALGVEVGWQTALYALLAEARAAQHDRRPRPPRGLVKACVLVRRPV